MIRDKGECAICGRGPRYLNLSHIIPEEITQFNLVLDNVLMLCPSHHKLGNWSFHKNPIWFAEWLKEHRPNQYQRTIIRLQELENDL